MTTPFSYEEAAAPAGFSYEDATGTKKGNLSRGAEVALRQIPQTVGGAIGLAGDALGAKGLRDYGMGIYEGQSKAIQAMAQPSDSFSNVLDGTGSLSDFLPYATGYVGGQAATALATGGVGGFVGRKLAERGVAGLTAEAAKQAVQRGTAAGAGTALGGYNFVQEAGSIYPDAVEQAQKEGRTLTGGDLARVTGAAALAAGVETLTDTKMLKGVLHGASDAPTLAGRALRTIPAAAAREAGTEAVQTGLERAGAEKSLTDSDAIRDYVDSAALGGVGGAYGGAASAVHRSAPPAVVIDPSAGPTSRAAALLAAPTTPSVIRADANGTAIFGQDLANSQAAAGNPGAETGAYGQGRNTEPIAPAAPPAAPALPFDNSPTGVLVAGPDGVMRPELRAEAVQRNQEQDVQRQARNERAQKDMELGLPGDTVEPTGEVTRAGEPFRTRIGAMGAAKRAGAGFQVEPVEGGYVVRRAPDQATDVEPKQAAAQRVADVTGDKIDDEWTAFSPASGTKSIPRADMPQIQAEHRGAMVNFLAARGITHENVEIPAADLKPAQAEFSPDRVKKAGAFTGGERSILVSSDGHILDGTHQWLDKLGEGDSVKAIRLDAPIEQLIATVKEFPSAQTSDGAAALTQATAPDARAAATGQAVGNNALGDGLRGQAAPAVQPDAALNGNALTSKLAAAAPAGQGPQSAQAPTMAADGASQSSTAATQAAPALQSTESLAAPASQSAEVLAAAAGPPPAPKTGPASSQTASVAGASAEATPQATPTPRTPSATVASALETPASELQQGRTEAQGKVGLEASPSVAPLVDDSAERYGRSGTALSQGGKPFKTKLGAVQFQQTNQPQSRVVKVDGGFALRNKSDKELTAEQEAGKRRQTAARAASYEKNPFITFLATHGLYHEASKGNSQKSEFSPDKHILVPGYGMVFRRTGLHPDVLATHAAQEGYLPPGREDVTALQDLIHRAIRGERVAPVYAQGEAEKEMERRTASFEDMRQEQDGAVDGADFDPFPPAEFGYTPDDEEAAGYDKADPAIQAEVRALLALASAHGIDTESILMDAAHVTQNQSEDAYHDAAKSALEAAIARSDADSRAHDGQQGQAASAATGQEVAPHNSSSAASGNANQEQGDTPAPGKRETPPDGAKKVKQSEAGTTKAAPKSAAKPAAEPKVAKPAAVSPVAAPAPGNAAPTEVAKPAEKLPTPEELKAKADLASALADLGDILTAGQRLNITPEQEAKLMPVLARVFDAAFRLGHIKFKQAAKYVLEQIRAALGTDAADAITIDHLQGAYIAMGGKYKAQGADSAKAVVAVESKAEIDQSADNEGDHVPSASSSVERDSGQPAAEPAVVDAVPDEPGPDGQRTGDAGQGARGPGSGRQDNPRLPATGPAVVGERGDQQFPGGKPPAGPAPSAPGDLFGQRGPDDGVPGVQVDAIPARAVTAAARVHDERSKREAQRAAASVAVKPGDLANIREALPYLLEGQQEDVHKAETRFAKPTGYGMLFTNGTGTGKTFSGLGIIKRFERQGRTNQLVVVPDQKILEDWVGSATALDLTITPLVDTKDAGRGIVITTYANLGANDELAKRNWDHVTADEAHMLMQAADGTNTLYLDRLRAITHHPDGVSVRHSMLHRDLVDELADLQAKSKAMGSLKADSSPADNAKAKDIQRRMDALMARHSKTSDAVRDEVKASQGAKRSRLTFLSATPFAYEKTIDWANGYLFDYTEGYPHTETSLAYNTPTPREHFFITHLGYRMRYGKLTQPDAKVDSGLMQRQFNGWLKKQGVLSGRMLDVPADYDRRFIAVESAIGTRIDDALTWVGDKARGEEKLAGMEQVRKVIEDQFDYLSRRYLLEAIKAQEVVPIVKQHLAMGRKVVVFHDYKKGGGFNPFDFEAGRPTDKTAEAIQSAKDFNAARATFRAQFPDLVGADLGNMRSPIEVFKREIPDVLLINGDEKKADLLKRYDRFQDDASGPLVALVQSAKNKGWSGHDTTGKNQRVLINLGQPTQPTLSIQQEGRIYRTGQVSNAIFRYLNTGTAWERWAFATTIANRASAAENLGMGELARALKDAYITGFEESGDFPPGHPGEGTGGKERDKAANNALTEYDRAKAFYWGTGKKTAKTKAQEGKDYFATPEPVGLKMVQWASVHGGEDMLEPSGGHGAIARWFPELANRTAIEPSMALRARMAMVFDGKIVDGTFEDHSVVNKYDGIVMNPPFGVGGKTAIEHLAKAETHLRDGGRIVALIPRGPMADKRLEKFLDEREAQPLGHTERAGDYYAGDTVTLDGRAGQWEIVGTSERGVQFKPLAERYTGDVFLRSHYIASLTSGPRTEKSDLYLIADVALPSVTFERAGTSVSTHIVVLQKGKNTPQQINRDYSDVDDINKLFDRLEDLTIAPRPEKADAAEPPVRKSVAPARTLPPVDPKKLVEITTSKGKVLRGVIREDMTLAQAKAIDPFTWKPKGYNGFFIREKYLQGDSFDQGAHARDGEEGDLLSGYDRQEALDKQAREAAAREAEEKAKTARAPAGKKVTADQVDLFNPQGGLFRMGNTGTEAMTVSQVQAAVRDLTAKWKNGPAVKVVADSSELGAKTPNDVRGLYRNGTMYVVAGKHQTLEQLARTIGHEAVAHYGLRTMLGREAWQGLMDRIQEGVARGDKALVDLRDYVRRTYVDNEGNSELSPRLEADEIAARAVEQAIDPATGEFRPGFEFLKSVWAKVAAFLRDLGLTVPFTNAELQGMLVQAQKHMEVGKRSAGGGQTAVAAARDESQAPMAARGGYLGDLSPEQERALKAVGALKVPKTLAERFGEIKANLGLRITQGIFDQFAPIKDVSPQAYLMARLSKGSEGTMEAALLYGKPFLRDGVPDVDATQGGFAKVLAALKGEHDRFLWWVAANRAERLKAEGRENLFTDRDIGALKSLAAGAMADGTDRAAAYRTALAGLNDFNDSVLKMAVESGLIDEEARELFKGQPYVPFYRVMAEEMTGPRFSSGLVNQQAYKKLKGGTSQLNDDLLENMLLNWAHLYTAAARNRAALATMEAADRLAIAHKGEGKKAVKVMRNGLAEHWVIEDPYLLEAITALHYTPSPLMAPLAKMKQVLTFSVTVNPAFKVRNLLRDSISAMGQADLSYNPLKNVAQGWKSSSMSSQTYASMLASGGVMRFGSQENANRMRHKIEKLGGKVVNDTEWKSLTSTMGQLWDAYNDLGDRSENVNRTALYDQLVAKGKTHAEASFMARDLMDFSMSGKWAVVRFLTQTVPFLNARLQGIYKLGRAAQEDPKRFATITGAVALASLALLAAYHDDDDWKKREDWDRDTWWWFKIGQTAYRIPKPFEIGAIGTLAERTAELMFSKEMTKGRFADRLAFMSSQTFSLNPVPQAVSPLFDVYANRDAFTRRPIESRHDKSLLPQDRHDERTSEVARFLGQLGLPEPLALFKGEYNEVSPKQWDFLLRGYFSWVGGSIASVSDYAVRPMLDRGERPDTKIRGGFVEPLPSGGSRYVTAFYEQAKDIEEAFASYRAALKEGDTERAQTLMGEGKLLNHVAAGRVRQRLEELNAAARRVEGNRLMAGEAKRTQLDVIDRQRHEVARSYVQKNP